MDRRTFLAGTGAVLLAAPLAAEGQQAGRVYWIGLLEYSAPDAARQARWNVFRQRMRELGYVEGQNVSFELWQRLQRRPVSDIGDYVTGPGGHEGGGRCRRALMLTILWSRTIRRLGNSWRDAFVYFKHEEARTGPAFARQLQAFLNS